MDEKQDQQYTAPQVEDLGDLAELTQATAFTGTEDGGSKAQIHHSAPQSP